MEDNYYPMEYICDYLQSGGGTGRRRTTYTDTRILLNEFIRRGWRPEYVNTTFRRLHDRLTDEYPHHKFIEEYAMTASRRLGLDSYEAVADVLIQIGLRPDVAAHLEYIVEPLRGHSYTDIQIIDTAIFYLLGYYTPLTSPDTKYLHHTDITDRWISYTHESRSLSIYNLPRCCSVSRATSVALEAALASLPRPTVDSTLYFHTTSWRGSQSIMEGVSRLIGRKCLDFGIYPGFYMTPTSMDALEWGHVKTRNWSNEVAIMIFAVPDTRPSTVKYKELVGDEWAYVTRHSRQCNDEMDVKLIRSIDLLYGDMVHNTSGVKRGQLPLTHDPPKKQLVSKTDAGDSFIDSCLVGCIYFRK
jgi:hypothetical protein